MDFGSHRRSGTTLGLSENCELGGIDEQLRLSHHRDDSFVSVVLFVPRMVAVQRPAENVTALSHPIRLTELFGARFGVVMARAQRGELIEGRKCLGGRSANPIVVALAERAIFFIRVLIQS